MNRAPSEDLTARSAEVEQDAGVASFAYATPPGTSPEAALAAWLEGARAERRGNLTRGLDFADRAWACAAEHGFLAEQIEAGRLRVHFLFRSGRFQALIGIARQVLPLLEEQDHVVAQAEVLRSLTLGAALAGDFDTALAAAHDALALARRSDDRRLTSMALNALGACLERMGDPWQAERLMHEAAALLGEQATEIELMATHNNLAAVALGAYHLLSRSGHETECAEALERALHHAQAARPHALAMRDPHALVLADAHYGEALLLSGRIDEARTVLAATLANCQRHAFAEQTLRIRCALAEASLANGRVAQAHAELQALLREPIEAHGELVRLRLWHAAYLAARRLGHIEQALYCLERYHALEHTRSVAQLMAQARYVVTRLEAERLAGIYAGKAQTEPRDGEAPADPLTGLGNREALAARMPQLVREAESRGAPLTLALIDMDRFETLRERFGQDAAERVLQQFARLLADNIRGADLPLRWDDDAFLVALPDTDGDRAFEVCERLREAVEAHPWGELAEGLEVTLSVGLASAPPYATDLLIGRAESAMYRAKHLGRNRVALA